MDKPCTRCRPRTPMIRCRFAFAAFEPVIPIPTSSRTDILPTVVGHAQKPDPRRLLTLLVPQQLVAGRACRLHWHLCRGVRHLAQYGEQPGQLCQPRVWIWCVSNTGHEVILKNTVLMRWLSLGSLLLVPAYHKFGRRPVMLASLITVRLRVDIHWHHCHPLSQPVRLICRFLM